MSSSTRRGSRRTFSMNDARPSVGSALFTAISDSFRRPMGKRLGEVRRVSYNRENMAGNGSGRVAQLDSSARLTRTLFVEYRYGSQP